MKIRVKDNVWTHVEWWDQIGQTSSDAFLKKTSPESPDIIFSIYKIKSPEKLDQLVKDLYEAVFNNMPIFDVVAWISRSKKRSTSNNKTVEK